MQRFFRRFMHRNWQDLQPMSAPSSFYQRAGIQWIPTELCRGPWNVSHQHGGPPAALLAGCIEAAAQQLDPTMRLVRYTGEILRPIPLAPLEVKVEPYRAGRKVHQWSAQLTHEGQVLIAVHANTIRTTELAEQTPEETLPVLPAPETCPTYGFDFFTAKVAYHTAIEARIARGNPGEPSVTAWLRLRVPLIEGQVTRPCERVLVFADAQSGIAHCTDPKRFSFVNPDLTVYFQRPAIGEWIALDARGEAMRDGTGLAYSTLYDAHGKLGKSLQSLIVEAR